MIFTDKNILIVGSGISGMGALKALSTVQARCTVFDGNDKLQKKILQRSSRKDAVPRSALELWQRRYYILWIWQW